jgi:hypothetical protein
VEVRRHRWEDNIKMDLKKMVWASMDWIGMAQDRNKGQAVLDTVMNIRILWNACNFLISGRTDGFSRTLFRGVCYLVIIIHLKCCGTLVDGQWVKSTCMRIQTLHISYVLLVTNGLMHHHIEIWMCQCWCYIPNACRDLNLNEHFGLGIVE